MNIDRSLPQDSIFRKTKFNGRFSFTSDKNRNNLVDMSTSAELDRHFKNNYVFLVLAQADVTSNGKQSLQNDGYLHLRYRDNKKRKMGMEEYIQYQWNGSWGMEHRILGGANVRFKLFDKKNFDMYAGLGVLHEWERWNWSGVKEQQVPPNAAKVYRQTWRLNNYWKVAGKISPMIDVVAATFLQFPFNSDFIKPRWFVDANVFVKTGKHFSIVIHWDHILDDHPAVPISNYFYSFSSGFQINY